MLPDTEAACVYWAKNNTALNAVLSGRVSTNLAADPSGWPFLTVFRVGGQPVRGSESLIDRALIQWDVWGDTIERDMIRATSHVARVLVAEAHHATGTKVTPDGPDNIGWIYGFEVITGPRRVPQPDTNRSRFIVETFVTIRGEE